MDKILKEIIKRFKLLNVKNDVRPTIAFSREIKVEVEIEENNKWEKLVIGMLMPTPPCNLNAIRGALRKALTIPNKDFEVLYINTEMILIKFEKELDMERVEHKQPININNSLLVLRFGMGLMKLILLNCRNIVCGSPSSIGP